MSQIALSLIVAVPLGVPCSGFDQISGGLGCRQVLPYVSYAALPSLGAPRVLIHLLGNTESMQFCRTSCLVYIPWVVSGVHIPVAQITLAMEACLFRRL